NLIPFQRLKDEWIQVLCAALEFEEKRLVVDACAQERNLVVRHADPARQHLRRALDAVAQTDMRPAGAIGYRPAVDRYRIDVVEQQCVWGKVVHILAQIKQHRNGAQAAEDTAWAKCIADALLDA